MLLYEHKRTEDIISRLVAIAKIIRTSIIITYAFFGGILLALLGALATAKGNTVGGGSMGLLIGAGIGYLIGKGVAGLVTVFIEWMAQVLVAQGEIVNALKKRSQ